MPCQICGKYSAFYPLCKKHFEMRDQNLVNKCSTCGVWFEGIGENCSPCSKGITKEKNLIYINRQACQKWAKRLYAIGKTGCEYSQTEYDTERYENLTEFASTIYQILETKPDDNPLGFTPLNYRTGAITSIIWRKPD